MDLIDTIWSEYEEAKPVLQTVSVRPVSFYECRECGGPKVFSGDGLPCCSQCGLCDAIFIDDSPEWMSGVNEDGSVTDGARCGAPKDTQLFSEQWGSGSIICTKGAKTAMKRLATINFHGSMNHRDRALYHAYKNIDEIAKDVLKLPDSVSRDAKLLYRKFNGKKLTRGAVRVGIKANCILYACKLSKVPRTTKEIADAFGIPTKDISRTDEIFKETIFGDDRKSTVTRPHDVIHRLLNEFNLEDKRKTKMKCIRLAEQLEQCVALMGKTPTSIASVVILKVLGDLTNKQDICKRCAISLPTLNKIELIVNQYLEGTIV